MPRVELYGFNSNRMSCGLRNDISQNLFIFFAATNTRIWAVHIAHRQKKEKPRVWQYTNRVRVWRSTSFSYDLFWTIYRASNTPTHCAAIRFVGLCQLNDFCDNDGRFSIHNTLFAMMFPELMRFNDKAKYIVLCLESVCWESDCVEKGLGMFSMGLHFF